MQWFYWLLAFLLSAGAGYWVYLSDKRRAVPYPWVTSLLRGLVIFFTVLLVLVPAITITKNTEEKPVVLFLQDNSASVGAALGADTAQYRKDAEQLIQKLAGKYTVVKWGFGADAQQDSGFHYDQPVTDISAALSRVQEYYGLQNLGAVVLASDGRYNQGMNPALQQLALHSTLYGVCIGDTAAQKDLAVSGVYANKIVSLNSSFEIRADILAKLCSGYNNTVQLTEGGQVLATSPLVINADKFDRASSFTVKADKAGLHHYVVTTAAAEGEKNVANNRRDIFVEVLEQKKNILIVSAAPHPDVNAIKDALAGVESYNIYTATADNFPANIALYDAIVLHGLPSSHNDISRQVLAAKKPVWLILTSQTNLAAVNSMRDLTFSSVTNGPVRDVVPAYNTSFNTFLLPRQVQTVTDKLPPLTVSSGNVQSAPGNNALFLQRNIADGGNAPMWMMQQGVVPVAILAGEGVWRWRLYEYKNFGDHAVVDECIRQTVAFLCSAAKEKQFSVSMPKYVWRDQEPISLSARLLNANNEQVNTPDVTLTILDSAGNKKDFTLERRGTAYALNLGVWAGGTYTYKAHTLYNGKDLYTTGSFAVESIPVELMEQGADYGLMYAMAHKYNGSVVARKDIAAVYDSITRNQNIKPLLATTTESVPFIDRKRYFFIILLIAVAEWLLRKYWLAQ
jgi:hypothetical protein